MYEHARGGPRAGRWSVAALSAGQRELRRAAHQTLAKVTDDIGRRRNFNTAIAAVMELLNAAAALQRTASAQGRAVRQEALEIAVLVLSPIVPHVVPRAVAGRWARTRAHRRALAGSRIPAALDAAQVEIIVQVNGKLRGHVSVPVDSDEARGARRGAGR